MTSFGGSAEWNARFLRLRPKCRDLLLGLQKSGSMDNLQQHIDHRALEQLSDFDETSQTDIISNFVSAVQERPLRNPSAYLCSLITTRRRNNSNNPERTRMPPEAVKRVHDLLRRHLAEDLQTINIETIDTQCKVALAQMPEEMAVKCLNEFKARPSGVYLRNPSAYLMSTIRRVTSAPAPLTPAEIEQAEANARAEQQQQASAALSASSQEQSGDQGAASPSSSANTDAAHTAPSNGAAHWGSSATSSPTRAGPLQAAAAPSLPPQAGPGYAAALTSNIAGAPMPARAPSTQPTHTTGLLEPTGSAQATPRNLAHDLPPSISPALAHPAPAHAGYPAPALDAATAPAPSSEARSQRDIELEIACRRVQELTLQNEMLRASLAAQGRLPPELGGVSSATSAPASILASSVQSPSTQQQQANAAGRIPVNVPAAAARALGAIGSRPQSAAGAGSSSTTPAPSSSAQAAAYSAFPPSYGGLHVAPYGARDPASLAHQLEALSMHQQQGGHHAHTHAHHDYMGTVAAAMPPPMNNEGAHSLVWPGAQAAPTQQAAQYHHAHGHAAQYQAAAYNPLSFGLSSLQGQAASRASDPLATRYYASQRPASALDLEPDHTPGLGLGLVSVNPAAAHDSLLAPGSGLHFASLLEQGR